MRETVKSDICTFIWTKFTKTIVRKLGDDRIEEVFPFSFFFLGGGGGPLGYHKDYGTVKFS